MKKILLIALFLSFGLVFQAHAIFIPDSAKKNNFNNAQNRDYQNSNASQDQNSANFEANKDMSGSNPGEQRKSQVANAVKSLLQVADRNEGIGQQVRTIAISQNKNQEKLEGNIEEIQKRGRFAKFFIGPKYREIKEVQATLEQNREQIQQLNQIRTQISDNGDQQRLAEQIKILQQTNQEIETLLAEAQNGFSLFGWFNKLIS